jgi:hypothetical protein
MLAQIKKGNWFYSIKRTSSLKNTIERRPSREIPSKNLSGRDRAEVVAGVAATLMQLMSVLGIAGTVASTGPHAPVSCPFSLSVEVRGSTAFRWHRARLPAKPELALGSPHDRTFPTLWSSCPAAVSCVHRVVELVPRVRSLLFQQSPHRRPALALGGACVRVAALAPGSTRPSKLPHGLVGRK